MIPFPVTKKELAKEMPFTMDIDLAHRKTPFGIRGLGYDPRIKSPLDVEQIIARAIRRDFSLRRDRLSKSEVEKAAKALARTYNRTLKREFKKCSVSKDWSYVGSDLGRLSGESSKSRENFAIAQKLILLLATAALRQCSVEFG